MEVLKVVLERPRNLNKADLEYRKHVPGKDGGSERFTVGKVSAFPYQALDS